MTDVEWRRHYKTKATFSAVRNVTEDLGQSVDAPHILRIASAIFYHFDAGNCECINCKLERDELRDDLSRRYRQL